MYFIRFIFGYWIVCFVKFILDKSSLPPSRSTQVTIYRHAFSGPVNQSTVEIRHQSWKTSRFVFLGFRIALCNKGAHVRREIQKQAKKNGSVPLNQNKKLYETSEVIVILFITANISVASFSAILVLCVQHFNLFYRIIPAFLQKFDIIIRRFL